jgi:hypothetical protein
MTRLMMLLALIIGLSMPVCGCKKAPPPPPPAPPVNLTPEDKPQPIARNQFFAPTWSDFRGDGYQLELPGEPKKENAYNTFRPITILEKPAFSYHIVTFVDSDLEFITFALPYPAANYRSLDHFNDTFEPILPTKNNERLGRAVNEKKVEVDGKKGMQLTFKAGPRDVLYRMFLADKVYVVAAVGSTLGQAEEMIERVFDSIHINAKQPDFAAKGKIPLDWQRWRGLVEKYEIDMPGKPASKPGIAKGAGLEVLTVTEIYGADMTFAVNAIRLNAADKRTDAEYLEKAKLKATTWFMNPEITEEKELKMDGQEAMELTLATAKGPAVCRVVRAPNRDFAFEIFVQGNKMADHRADIERFFGSFKFTKRK